MRRPFHKKQQGFTLIEILMAIVLGGLILTAAASFLFGIFNLTLQAEKEPRFEEHVNSTTRFLEFAFDTALPSENASQSNRSSTDDDDEASSQNLSDQSGSSSENISWKRIPGERGLNPEALSFRLPGDLPLFVDEEQAYLPEVECWLIFQENEGLLLRWRTDAMALEDDDETLTSLISPYVSSLTYWYYDQEDDSWEDSDEAELADEGGQQMPEFISLAFESPDGREAKRQLLLPVGHFD